MKADHPQYPFYIRGQFFGGVEDIAEGASRELLELERFEQERLRRTPSGLNDAQAERHAGIRIAKSCAGLTHEYRMTGPELRTALHRGILDARGRLCFDWVLSGMRSFETHELYNEWGLSIYALARTVALSYDGRHVLARWLNLWGADPERALPDHDGLSRDERAARRRAHERCKWLAALRTQGARKAHSCLEEAGDADHPHPRAASSDTPARRSGACEQPRRTSSTDAPSRGLADPNGTPQAALCRARSPTRSTSSPTGRSNAA